MKVRFSIFTLALGALLASGASANVTPPTRTEPVPEPDGYWTGPVNSPVPLTVKGGRVVHDAHELQTMLRKPGTVIVDVSNSPRRPEHLAQGAPWMPVPHRSIPGSLWIPGVGLGEVPPGTDEYFRHTLAAATGGDLGRRLVIYCHEACWLSWNAARRAISYGYRHVYWYRKGIEGWLAAGFPTEVVQPRLPPDH